MTQKQLAACPKVHLTKPQNSVTCGDEDAPSMRHIYVSTILAPTDNQNGLGDLGRSPSILPRTEAFHLHATFSGSY